MPAPPLPLETERLLLRPVERGDVEALLAYYGDPEVARYLPFGVLDRAGVEERIGRWLDDEPAAPGSAKGAALHAMVETRDDGRLIGDVLLQLAKGDPVGVGEIGWSFRPDVGGRGYATEAARPLLRLAFEHYGLHRVFAQLDPRNTASSRLCARLGMTHEALLRRDFQEGDGRWTDNEIWGLLREEWDHGS